MGVWSSCVMGGDTPYDVAGTVEDILGIRRFERMHMPDDWTKRERSIVRKAIDKIGMAKLFAIAKPYRSHQQNVVYQVIGLLAISCGAKLSKADRRRIIAACNDDEWALESEERRAYMDELAKAVKDYDGTPVVLRQLGHCLNECLSRQGGEGRHKKPHSPKKRECWRYR